MAAHGTIRPARQRFGRRRCAGPGGPLRGAERFDVLPLLVATNGAIAALGEDGRRLRPNIVLSGVPGLAERTWPGSALRIGDALVGVQSVRGRCIVTTIDPDTGAQDLDVLRKIHREFDGTMALNCWVVRGAHIQVGNQVEVVDLDIDPPAAGGWITGAPYSVATSAATVRGSPRRGQEPASRVYRTRALPGDRHHHQTRTSGVHAIPRESRTSRSRTRDWLLRRPSSTGMRRAHRSHHSQRVYLFDAMRRPGLAVQPARPRCPSCPACRFSCGVSVQAARRPTAPAPTVRRLPGQDTDHSVVSRRCLSANAGCAA